VTRALHIILTSEGLVATVNGRDMSVPIPAHMLEDEHPLDVLELALEPLRQASGLEPMRHHRLRWSA
jgi:hypothetical protein